MQNYESKDIAQWLKGAFSVEQHIKSEVKMACPECGHLNFYFNINKKIGFCHRATCHFKPSLQDLIDKVGYGPEDAGWVPRETQEKNQEYSCPVQFPPGTKLIVEDTPKREVVNDEYAWRALRFRLLSTDDILRYKLHCNYNFIYIPIYDSNNTLIQYIGRRIDRRQPPHLTWELLPDIEHERYRYGKGIPISQFLWDWDHWRYQRNLVLVENTFNAIKYGWCTNFGSHLSDKQLDMIQRSMVSNVVLLWDENTEHKQHEAAEKLRKRGVNTIAVDIKGQPDDHKTTNLRNIVDNSIKLLIENKAKRAVVHYNGNNKGLLDVKYVQGF